MKIFSRTIYKFTGLLVSYTALVFAGLVAFMLLLFYLTHGG